MNIDNIIEAAKSPQTKERAAEAIYKMPQDFWHFRYVRKMVEGIEQKPWFNLLTFLNAFATIEHPGTYLEIGVRKGGSMAQVLSASPVTRVYGFDMWPPDYAVVENWPHVPGSAAMVRDGLRQFKPLHEPWFSIGNSEHTVPRFFAEHPDFTADLALVDGDHSEEGARKDLAAVFPRARVIVFDDIVHPMHKYLDRVFDEAVATYGKGWRVFKDYHDVGTAVAFRP